MVDRKINERAEKRNHRGLVVHQKRKADAGAANQCLFRGFPGLLSARMEIT
jgi:hypothetical protein